MTRMLSGGNGHYALGARLGAGGLGVVYAATAEDGAHVAVKFLQRERQDARALRRFRDEAVAGRLVDHPNVAAIVDDGHDDSAGPFLVMQRARGEALGALIARSGVLPPRDAIEIAREILAGLAAIHDAGIVHADIKSDNVLVRRIDGRYRVTLIDFGLAHPQFTNDAGPRGELVDEWLSGTPEYMAPEIVRGFGAGFASDLYAVGVILYEMLTGNTPFAGGTPTEIVQRQVSDAVVPPSLRTEQPIGSALEYTILRALSKDPAHRYDSATAFDRALSHIAPRLAPTCRREVLRDRTDEDAPTLVGTPRRRLARGTPARSSR